MKGERGTLVAWKKPLSSRLRARLDKRYVIMYGRRLTLAFAPIGPNCFSGSRQAASQRAKITSHATAKPQATTWTQAQNCRIGEGNCLPERVGAR